jgi:hypothetical protein
MLLPVLRRRCLPRPQSVHDRSKDRRLIFVANLHGNASDLHRAPAQAFQIKSKCLQLRQPLLEHGFLGCVEVHRLRKEKLLRFPGLLRTKLLQRLLVQNADVSGPLINQQDSVLGGCQQIATVERPDWTDGGLPLLRSPVQFAGEVAAPPLPDGFALRPLAAMARAIR